MRNISASRLIMVLGMVLPNKRRAGDSGRYTLGRAPARPSGNLSTSREVGILTTNLSRNGVAHNSAEKPLAGRRILLAEDEGLIALELERMLEEFGCEVVGPLASVDEVLETPNAAASTVHCLTSICAAGRFSRYCRRCKSLDWRLIITSGYDDVTLFPAPFRSDAARCQTVRRKRAAAGLRKGLRRVRLCGSRPK